MIIQEQRIPINIEDEMRSSFIDYAMSVIVGRALPDVRDGLKPVHRRVLYGVQQMGLLHNKPYRKSAKIIGEVMGNYHPHGDAAIYDTMVRMAQDFSLRYPLVDGQGNFGSVDGDPPAAMRYTEARLAQIAEELLRDIDKDTVDLVPNYDESLTEPVVLPAALPNLMINGASGIAVGMATNIPPHNLTEVVDAVVHLIEHPDATIEELMEFVPGPDFPTGGFIFGREGIVKAYHTGRGLVVMRARAAIEVERRTGRERIVITELPYQLNKASLVEKIAHLVKDKKLTGISDLRDESDREGIRVVVEVKRDEDARVILNRLFKQTPLQSTFGVNMLALAGGRRPKLFNLKTMLEAFIQHRREVVYRRTLFELRKAEARAHILEGLKKALDFIDEVIAIIRGSDTGPEARERLIERFSFSEIQAQAILDMRLQRLTGLEREKLEREYIELLKLIERMQAIIDSEVLLMNEIKSELLALRDKFGDERRTEIVEATGDIDAEDLIADEDMVVFITHENYVKRTPVSLYRAQKRRTKGRTGIAPKEGDFVDRMFVTSTHNYMLVFTSLGKVYALKVYRVPQGGPAARGRAIANILSLGPQEKVAAVLPVKAFEEGRYVVMATRRGMIKKTAIVEYEGCTRRSGGIIALNIKEGDELISVQETSGQHNIFIATRGGMAIRFDEREVRPMGRTAAGVTAIRLAEDDEVVGMAIVRPQDTLTILTVTENGYGKRSRVQDYRPQRRAGKGLINIKVTEKTGPVVSILRMAEGDEMLMITSSGKLLRQRISEESVRILGRNTQGVRMQDVSETGSVVAIARIPESDNGPRRHDANGDA
jgi:DNA gyrase subunit A